MSRFHNPFVGKTYEKYLKRVLDILLASVLLVIFSPICFLTALAIKLNSKGAFFADVPERIGQNMKRFKMYKFRSMITNAHTLLRTDPRFRHLYEEYRKGSYKLKRDPRITI